jgi:hypothetical protein
MKTKLVKNKRNKGMKAMMMMALMILRISLQNQFLLKSKRMSNRNHSLIKSSHNILVLKKSLKTSGDGETKIKKMMGSTTSMMEK